MEDNIAVPPADRIPSGTYENVRYYQSIDEGTLHAVCSFGEHLYDKLSVLFAPSPHLLVRINN